MINKTHSIEGPLIHSKQRLVNHHIPAAPTDSPIPAIFSNQIDKTDAGE
jgi:hypothetical protein